MSTTVEPFVLDAHANLFRDQGAFQEFVNIIELACRTGATPFLSRGKIIGVTVSQEMGKKLLCDHIITQWMKDPTHLKKIADSMLEEPIPMS